MTAKEIAGKYGCGDNSCMFGSPGGMATNGGCACFDRNTSIPAQRKIRAGIMALRQELKETEDAFDKVIAENNVWSITNE